jgi:hypothetical protein
MYHLELTPESYETAVVLLLQEHFMEVMNNQEFLLLPGKELSNLLSSDDLNVPSEEHVFQVTHL